MFVYVRFVAVTVALFLALFPVSGWSQDAPDRIAPSRGEIEVRSDATVGGESQDEAAYLGLVAGNVDLVGNGVQVLAVRVLGAADAAGIRPGDYILSIGETRTGDLPQMEQTLANCRVGDVVRIEIIRRSKLLTVEATLAQRSVGGDWITGRPLLGIRVDSAAGVAGRTTGGALVREVKPGSPADRGELPPGAVIVAMDDRPIVSAQDLTESVWQSRPGQTIELEYFIGQTRKRQFFRLAAADAMPATPRDGQRILPQRPVVDPAHREFSERDLYLLEPDRNSESDGDIDSLRATVHKLEQHVQVLQAQLEETTRLLFEIKQQIEERESPLED